MRKRFVRISIIFIFLYFLFFKIVWASKPRNIRVTDISATEFVVSWTGYQKEIGLINYGKSSKQSIISTAKDIRGDISDYIHYIRVKSLSPETLYKFEIISGTTTDNNHGQYYSVKTSEDIIILPVDLCKPSGQIIKPLPSLSRSVIIYLTIFENGEFSETKSKLVTFENDYSWRFDLINFKTLNLKKKFQYFCGKSMVLVEAEAGLDGVAWMITDAVHSKTSSNFRPEMVLKELPKSDLCGAILILKSLVGIGYFPVLDMNNNFLDISDVLYMLIDSKK
jgi:hypothetical protein